MPNLPASAAPGRMIPALARAASSKPVPPTSPTAPTATVKSRPQPSREHLIKTYPSEAFPRGFSVGAMHAGVKKKAGALDLGVLVSTTEQPAAAAACTTRNVFKAAPVTVTAELLHNSGGRAKGFVVNAGCANAVTGKKGLEDAWAMSNTLTSLIPSISSSSSSAGSLVMSTGVIGVHLPIDKITSSLPKVVEKMSPASESWADLSKAFMTTDTFPKLRAREFRLGDRIVRMAGIDKGAGMIAPSMGPPPPPHATLLGVIATDAAVSPKALQSALNYAVDRSFNSITVDGDMSTNDTILCLANGAAEVVGQSAESTSPMKELEESDEAFGVFREELREMAEDLAKLVARDGEGATKFVTVRVVNAPSHDVANAVAKSVASSSLVKTALYGEDANWGRILCAVGYTPLPEGTISPTAVSVSFVPPTTAPNTTPLRLLTNGEPEPEIDEARASEILKEEDLEILVDLNGGSEEATVWTCDFSHDYVTINGDYRS